MVESGKRLANPIHFSPVYTDTQNMNHTHLLSWGIWCSLILLLFSCTAAPPARPAPPPRSVPERPAERPGPGLRPSEYIMGEGQIGREQLVLFLAGNNPAADRDFTRDLARYYIEEAAVEGVNHDAAFAQMCLETGFLRFGGLVRADMNNFCGLGAIGPGQNGEAFPDPRTGVRAHIQHLKAYATIEPLNGALVDPRYKWVKYGSSPTIQGLSGTWAADKSYSVKIGSILRRLYDFSVASEG